MSNVSINAFRSLVGHCIVHTFAECCDGAPWASGLIPLISRSYDLFQAPISVNKEAKRINRRDLSPCNLTELCLVLQMLPVTVSDTVSPPTISGFGLNFCTTRTTPLLDTACLYDELTLASVLMSIRPERTSDSLIKCTGHSSRGSGQTHTSKSAGIIVSEIEAMLISPQVL